jgi:hypothetical protein
MDEMAMGPGRGERDAGGSLLAEHALPLQVPLAETASLRRQFLRELRESGGRSRLLYEDWVPRIGANGIVHNLGRAARYSPFAAERACAEATGWQRQVCEEARARQMYAMDKPFDRYPR